MSLVFLRQEALALGISLTGAAEQQFATYMAMLKDYNRHTNLTSITEETEVVRKHFLDSLSLVLAAKIEGRAIDVGTGAGFPGLPLAIVFPHLELVLLDSLDKRVKFLREVVSALNLSARVKAIHARAEDAGQLPEHREKYDLVFSRAVARLNLLAEFCLPFAKVGGTFIAMKGPSGREEIEEAKLALTVLGGGGSKELIWKLPGEAREERIIVSVTKICSTPKKYPRKAGLPAKKPLV